MMRRNPTRRHCRIYSCLLVIVLATAVMMPAPAFAAARQAACPAWSAWEGFKARFVDRSGRVIDPSTPNRHSTSEGQSYALFYALVANDRESFDRVLQWTINNLAGGDLTARLPAWQWGRREDGSWQVIDENAASDSDLWIAYALAEAGRLWQVPRYQAIARLLAERILREETAQIQGFGRTLLPGPVGFQLRPDVYRLNPSYVPIQLMRRFASLYPQPEWKQLLATSIDTIVRSSPRGYAPDWVLFSANSGFTFDPETNGVGSYNAIRVYLWAGMLAPSDPVRPMLLRTLAPAARYVVQNGTPPLEVDTRTGVVSGAGPAGFSSAMLPFLAASRQQDAYNQQQLRINALAPLERSDNYYDQVLTLFALGWVEGRYHFARNGALRTKWTCAAN